MSSRTIELSLALPKPVHLKCELAFLSYLWSVTRNSTPCSESKHVQRRNVVVCYRDLWKNSSFTRPGSVALCVRDSELPSSTFVLMEPLKALRVLQSMAWHSDIHAIIIKTFGKPQDCHGLSCNTYDRLPDWATLWHLGLVLTRTHR